MHLPIKSHQRETIYEKINTFAKLIRQWKSKEWAKFELECLLLFLYSNSKFKGTCQNADFECRYIKTRTKEKLSKIFNITFPILAFCSLEYFVFKLPSRELWSLLNSTSLDENHQMRFRMVHSNVKMQNLELVDLKYVTCTQPISLSL